MKRVKIKKDFFFSNSDEIKFILGPCQIESRSHALDICSEIDILSKRLDFRYVSIKVHLIKLIELVIRVKEELV